MRRATWEASRCGQCHAPCLRCSPLSTCPLASTRVQVQMRGAWPCPQDATRITALSWARLRAFDHAPGFYRSRARVVAVGGIPSICAAGCAGLVAFAHDNSDIPCDGFSPPSRFPTAGKGSVGNAMGPLPFCAKPGWPLRWSDTLRCVFCADYLRKTECKASFRELPKAAPV